MIENIEIVSESGSEPITTAEAKAYLEVDFSDDDTLIDQLIKEARQFIESWCQVSLTVKSVRVDTTGEVDDYLPYYPITKSTIAVTDASSTAITPSIFGGGTSGKYRVEYSGSESESYSIAYDTTKYDKIDLTTACKMLVKSMYNHGALEPDTKDVNYTMAIKLINPYRLL